MVFGTTVPGPLNAWHSLKQPEEMTHSGDSTLGWTQKR